MIHLVRALRVPARDGVRLLPASWGDDDTVRCETPAGEIVVAPDGDGMNQVLELVERLRAAGYDAHGCFDCRYFVRSGMQVEAEGTVGYCLEGKLGLRLHPIQDTTTAESSCDAYQFGTPEDQKAAGDTWWQSVQRVT